MKRVLLILVSVWCLFPQTVQARRFSLGTNILGYAQLGTFNLEMSYAVSRRWNLTVGARYNPFTFNENNPEKQFQMRQQSYYVGARLWPWHTWSGWWFAAKVRYQEYNMGGIRSRETEEGDRVGAGLYAGYSLMLNKYLNLEFGAGMWSGVSFYTRYSCPSCGLTLSKGRKYFLLPDDLSISLVFVF